jgi:hypothetical protein
MMGVFNASPPTEQHLMPSDLPTEKTFLDLVSASWRELALSLKASGIRSNEHRSNQIEKRGIQIESLTHIALLEAWEHANCLDATIIERTTGASEILFAGPCGAREEIEPRLRKLCDTLCSHGVGA